MSFSSARPPTAFLDTIRSLKPHNFPEDSQPDADSQQQQLTTGCGPSLSSFARVNKSPMPNFDPNYNELIAPPPEHSAVRLLEQLSYPLPAPSVDGNQDRDEIYSCGGPSLKACLRVNNFPHTYVTPEFFNISKMDDAALTTTCVIILKKCFVCLSKNNWPQILSGSQRGVPIVKQMHLHAAMTLPETTSISKARRYMDAHTTNFLVLVDSNASLTGVLTNKDSRTTDIASEIDLENTPVSEVMTNNPFFVYSDTSALEVVQKMAQGNFIGVPVIEDDMVIAIIRQRLCPDHFRQAARTDTRIVLAKEAIAQWNFG